jgi:hypothetical protein
MHLKQRMDDEKIINMDLSALSEVQRMCSIVGCNKRSLLDVWAAAIFEIVDLVLICGMRCTICVHLWYLVHNLC